MNGAILSFMIILPAAAICLFPMKNQLRFSLPRTLLILGSSCLALIPVSALLAISFSLDPNELLFPMMALLFTVYHSCLRVHISKSLAVFCSVMALMSILGMYAACFDAYQNPTLGVNHYTPEYALFHLMISTAAGLLFAFPLLRYGSSLIDNLDIPSVWFWTLPFSSLLLGINIFLRPVKYETFHINRVAEAVMQIVSALLILWILMHVLFYIIVTSILRNARLQEEKQILEMRESQFVTQQRYMEATARERHDIRHNIRTLRELCDAGDYNAVREYLLQYEEGLPQNEVQPFCTNNALNALLNHYYHMASQTGIDIRIEMQIPDRFPLSDVEICRMFGNLLENAVESARNSEDPWIHLSSAVLHQAEWYIISTNSFDGNVRIHDGKYLSTRHKGDGIGLSSIKSIAESCGGTASFSHEGKEFYSNIVIPVSL